MRARSPATTPWEKALDSAVSFYPAPKGMDCTMLLCKSADDPGQPRKAVHSSPRIHAMIIHP